MNSTSVMEKCRAINKIILEDEGDVNLDSVAGVLEKVMTASIFIVDLQGVILGQALNDKLECDLLIEQVLEKGCFPARYNDFLLQDNDCRYNIPQKSKYCVFQKESLCPYPNRIINVVPLIGNGRRLGTLVLGRHSGKSNVEDVLLAEHSAGVIGLELVRAEKNKKEREERRREVVKLALNTLSFTELEAVLNIFAEFSGNENEKVIITSKIASHLNITGSVIVNALGKLISAGIIESFSLGMKGTLIKVKNTLLFDELKEHEMVGAHLSKIN